MIPKKLNFSVSVPHLDPVSRCQGNQTCSISSNGLVCMSKSNYQKLAEQTLILRGGEKVRLRDRGKEVKKVGSVLLSPSLKCTHIHTHTHTHTSQPNTCVFSISKVHPHTHTHTHTYTHITAKRVCLRDCYKLLNKNKNVKLYVNLTDFHYTKKLDWTYMCECSSMEIQLLFYSKLNIILEFNFF